mmetsp:Transcript_18403/g.24288  ORF Transcript_18403/g.24288 Transcript_18403/m.24288 type:complete len:219 (-) Transcript_18403:282-938(-)
MERKFESDASDSEQDKYYEKKQSSKHFRESDFCDPDLEDLSLSEKDLDDRVEAEWNAKIHGKQEGQILLSRNPVAKSIAKGFRINYMNMKDATTAEVLWDSEDWGECMFEEEMEARIPKKILDCRAVGRVVNFSSVEQMQNFNLEQRVFFEGTCIEEWFFYFGFVIPNSTNNWEQVIEAADPENMMSAEMLSGKVTIETTFLDGDMFIGKTLVRIYYV